MKKVVSSLAIDLDTMSRAPNVKKMATLIKSFIGQTDDLYFLGSGLGELTFCSYSYVLGSILILLDAWKEGEFGYESEVIRCINLVCDEIRNYGDLNREKHPNWQPIQTVALHPKPAGEGFPMDLQVMVYCLDKMGLDDLMDNIYPGYHLLRDVYERASRRCEGEFVQYEIVDELNRKLAQKESLLEEDTSRLFEFINSVKINGYPVLIPTLSLELKEKDNWLTRVCDCLNEKTLNHRVFICWPISIDGAPTQFEIMKVSRLVYALKIITFMKTQGELFNKNDFSRISSILTEKSHPIIPMATIVLQKKVEESREFYETFVCMHQLLEKGVIQPLWVKGVIRQMDVFDYLKKMMVFKTYIEDPTVLEMFQKYSEKFIEELTAFKECLGQCLVGNIEGQDLVFLETLGNAIIVFNEHQSFLGNDHSLVPHLTLVKKKMEEIVEIAGRVFDKNKDAVFRGRDEAMRKVHTHVVALALSKFNAEAAGKSYNEMVSVLTQAVLANLNKYRVNELGSDIDIKIEQWSMKFIISILGVEKIQSGINISGWVKEMMAWTLEKGGMDLLEWVGGLLIMSKNSGGHLQDPLGVHLIDMLNHSLAELFEVGQEALLNKHEQTLIPPMEQPYSNWIRKSGELFVLQQMATGGIGSLRFRGIDAQPELVDDDCLIETLRQLLRSVRPGLLETSERVLIIANNASLTIAAMAVALNRLKVLSNFNQLFFNDNCMRKSAVQRLMPAENRIKFRLKYQFIIYGALSKLHKLMGLTKPEIRDAFFLGDFTSLFLNLVVDLPASGVPLEFRFRMFPYVMVMLENCGSLNISPRFLTKFNIDSGSTNYDKVKGKLFAYIFKRYFDPFTRIDDPTALSRNEQVIIYQYLDTQRKEALKPYSWDVSGIMRNNLLNKGKDLVERLKEAQAIKPKSPKEVTSKEKARAKKIGDKLIEDEKRGLKKSGRKDSRRGVVYDGDTDSACLNKGAHQPGGDKSKPESEPQTTNIKGASAKEIERRKASLDEEFMGLLIEFFPKQFGWETIVKSASIGKASLIKSQVKAFKTEVLSNPLFQPFYPLLEHLDSKVLNAWCDHTLIQLDRFRSGEQIVVMAGGSGASKKPGAAAAASILPSSSSFNLSIDEFPELNRTEITDCDGDIEAVAKTVDAGDAKGMPFEGKALEFQLKENKSRYVNGKDWGVYAPIIEVAHGRLEAAKNMRDIDLYNQWFFTTMNLKDDREVSVNLQYEATWQSNKMLLNEYKHSGHTALKFLIKEAEEMTSDTQSPYFYAINRWIFIALRHFSKELPI